MTGSKKANYRRQIKIKRLGIYKTETQIETRRCQLSPNGVPTWGEKKIAGFWPITNFILKPKKIVGIDIIKLGPHSDVKGVQASNLPVLSPLSQTHLWPLVYTVLSPLIQTHLWQLVYKIKTSR